MKYFFSILVMNSVLAEGWVKHSIMETKSTVVTAVAGDYNMDGLMDVITSDAGKVLLLTAPNWKATTLYEFSVAKHKCIHSETFDVDGDGDLDYLGSSAHGKPFWLENVQKEGEWPHRVIDHDLMGIHCLLKADVDNDGKMDVIINNFKPEGELKNSIAWFSVPNNVKSASEWDRTVFAQGDAPGGSHYFGFGDLDGDGWGEIAAAAKGKQFQHGDWFAYWKNPGADPSGEAWDKVVVAEKRIGATNILVGDLNGDEMPDLLASQGHGVGVLWFEAPDWTPHVIDAELKSPHSLVLADLNQDGMLDAASCGFESERVSVYYNDGQGEFSRVDIDTDQSSYDLRAVDMDQDGDLDLLNAGRNSKNVVWYENTAK